MRTHKMATVREVLYQHKKKVSSRNIAKAFKISRTTIRKYIQLARAHGYSTGVNDKELQEIELKLRNLCTRQLIAAKLPP